MSTDSFLLAFHQFTSPRGKSHFIRSNNGTNFVGTEREIREVLNKLNQQKTTSTLKEDAMEWRFNTPLVQWMGGAIESMVKLTKRAIKVTINNHVLTEETLVTLPAEIKSIINSQPLTLLSDDPNTLEALTPNHILSGRPFTNPDIFVLNENQINDRAKQKMVQAFATMFWKQFVTE